MACYFCVYLVTFPEYLYISMFRPEAVLVSFCLLRKAAETLCIKCNTGLAA